MRSLISFAVAGIVAVALPELTGSACVAQSSAAPTTSDYGRVYTYRSYYRAYYPMRLYPAPVLYSSYYPAPGFAAYLDYYAPSYYPYDGPAYYAPAYASYYPPFYYYGAAYQGHHYWP
jgi:hypothetical protein